MGKLEEQSERIKVQSREIEQMKEQSERIKVQGREIEQMKKQSEQMKEQSEQMKEQSEQMKEQIKLLVAASQNATMDRAAVKENDNIEYFHDEESNRDYYIDGDGETRWKA